LDEKYAKISEAVSHGELDSKVNSNRSKLEVEIHNLSVRWLDTTLSVFSEISFSVHQGEFVGVVGQVGSGKVSDK